MSEDEADTVETLNAYKEIMFTLIKQHRGKVIDSPGDNLLAEFASVVDAVQCGVAVQKELQTRNAERLENRRMELRIGINLGDVIEEEDRIFGDGVNIAARLEALADPGGICISKTAFDTIETKLPLGYEYLGEKEVKNIAKPVGAYRVLMDAEAAGKVIGESKPKTKQLRGIAIGAVAVLIIVAGALAIWNFYFRPAFEPASLERMAFPLPDKPSIAVLPFMNISEDPKQKYLADGISKDIISALSQVPKLFVIQRDSTLTYKGKVVEVQQVAEELGVRYVLEGSVQKAGEKVRITAQLIDALSGHLLWAERYDRDLKDIFALQDEITIEIMSAIQVKLTRGEQARLRKKGTDDLEAYILVMQGYDYWYRYNKEGNLQARKLAEEAIALDPEYADAYCLLGQIHSTDFYVGLSKSLRKSLEDSAILLQKALAIDESHPIASSLLAYVYGRQGQHEKSLAQAEQAVALNPTMAPPNLNLCGALFRMGRYEEAIQYGEKAIRLDPKGPVPYFTILGFAYCFAGRYEDAIAAVKKAVDRAPNSALVHTKLAAIYSIAGREEEARAEVTEVLRLDPKFALKRYGKALGWRKVELEPWLQALRNAGLPETPPLPLPDKPSIAVLPFVNMSGDPEQEYLSDGFTEEIITALSKTPQMFVIARTSSFKYKGKEVDVRTVGRELGVRYLLEGSVRRSKEQLRITAQLVDAKTGNHLWAERYDREPKDVFAIQDEITKEIITALNVELTQGEQARIFAKGTDNLEAYLKFMQARENTIRHNIEGNALAQQLAQEAITLDPKYASAFRLLGVTHMNDIFLGRSKSPKESLGKAIKLVKKAIELDDLNGYNHVVLGYLLVLIRQYDKAVAEAERGVALAPNVADVYGWLGIIYRTVGRWEDAIVAYEKAIRLNPIPPNFYLYGLGLAYAWTGRYEEAITVFKKAIHGHPDSLYVRVSAAAVYSLAGRDEEARTEAAEVLRLNPKFSLNKLEKSLRYKNREDQEQFISALSKAGLK
jgi:adenylate cyclase